eukprot:jgi/Psemu1/58813/gm1.58813_g
MVQLTELRLKAEQIGCDEEEIGMSTGARRIYPMKMRRLGPEQRLVGASVTAAVVGESELMGAGGGPAAVGRRGDAMERKADGESDRAGDEGEGEAEAMGAGGGPAAGVSEEAMRASCNGGDLCFTTTTAPTSGEQPKQPKEATSNQTDS